MQETCDDDERRPRDGGHLATAASRPRRLLQMNSGQALSLTLLSARFGRRAHRPQLLVECERPRLLRTPEGRALRLRTSCQKPVTKMR